MSNTAIRISVFALMTGGLASGCFELPEPLPEAAADLQGDATTAPDLEETDAPDVPTDPGQPVDASATEEPDDAPSVDSDDADDGTAPGDTDVDPDVDSPPEPLYACEGKTSDLTADFGDDPQGWVWGGSADPKQGALGLTAETGKSSWALLSATGLGAPYELRLVVSVDTLSDNARVELGLWTAPFSEEAPATGLAVTCQRVSPGVIGCRLRSDAGESPPVELPYPSTLTIDLVRDAEVATLTVRTGSPASDPTVETLTVGAMDPVSTVSLALFGGEGAATAEALTLCHEQPDPCEKGCGEPNACATPFCNPLEGCDVSLWPDACDDGKACTLEGCDAEKGCEYTLAGEGCCFSLADCEDDGDACNGTVLCDEATASCVEEAPCVDENPCNGLEACDPALGCAAEKLVPPLACDDGDPCNGVEVCDAALGCVALEGTVKTCDDGKPCNGLETCNAAGGCDPGTPPECSDGDACNGEEACEAGVGCVAGEAPACAAPTACNGWATCDPTVGCVEGTPPKCDDDIECNGVESCDPIVGCVPGTPKEGCCTSNEQCDDGNPCNGIGFCNLGSGTCTMLAAPLCDDGNLCNGIETCTADGCASGAPLTCADDNPCNGLEQCDPTAGCVIAVGPPACDDKNACNGAESCVAGLGCQQTGPPLACDDGNLCNGLESCNPTLGACQPGVPLGCSDGLPCTGVEQCDPETGCIDGVPPEGCCKVPADCDDDNVCNGVWACSATNTCVLDTAQKALVSSCSDGDPCNGGEACDPTQGCVDGPPLDCSDGDPCNGVELCIEGKGCQGAAPLDCGDGDPCNGLETCLAGVGCQDGPALTCDDGNACNGAESCAKGVGCAAGAPPDCGPSDLCAGVTGCHPAEGCTSSGGLQCDDGDACNGKEGCSPSSGCVAGAAPACDDQDKCNGLETCLPASGCVSGAALTCDDSVECTADSCHATLGCQHVPQVDGCAPGSECQIAACDPTLGCQLNDKDGACDPPPGALAAECQDGACVVTSCQDGLTDCDDAVPGCETETAKDPKNCGACGAKEPAAVCLASEVCHLGACLAECPLESGLVKCGQSCVNTASDVSHCGGCEKPCPLAMDAATMGCADSTCVVEECAPGFGDLGGGAEDGCECAFTNAGVETCDGIDDDCNGVVDDIDPLTFATDPLNCGECGEICTMASPFAYGVCEASVCGAATCPSDARDLDGTPENACEYACPKTPIEAETCNELDDDCDGDVDEGFDLNSSLEHCGTCDQACVAGEHTTAVECVGGTCLVLTCEAGWVDEDAESTNGCEANPVYPTDLWVDDDEDDPGMNGSFLTPYDTLQKALNASSPGGRIRLRAGTYKGHWVLAEAVTIQGYEAGVILEGTAAQAVLQVTGDDVSVSDLSITGGIVGIHFAGTADAPIAGGSVRRVVADGIAPVPTDLTPHPVVAGIWAQHASGLVVGQLTIKNVTSALKAEGTTHDASVGAGIVLESVTSSLIVGNTLFNIHGRDGVGANDRDGSIGLGIGLNATTGCTFASNVISNLTAGTGNYYSVGVPTGTTTHPFAFYFFDNQPLDNLIELSNTAEGDPIVYLYGAKDITLSGLQLTGELSTTNLGKVVVANSEGVTLEDFTVSYQRGYAGASAWNAFAGGNVRGIYLTGCPGCTVSGSSVSDLIGGQGGFAKGTIQGPGGHVYGVAVEASPGASLLNNTITGAVGGPKGPAGGPAPGGHAGGILLATSPGSTLSGNSIHGLIGGLGSHFADYGFDNVATGLDIDGASAESTIDDTNTVEGFPVVFRYNPVGETISGYTIHPATMNMTNWGNLVVTGGQDAIISGNSVSGVTGRVSCSTCNGGDATGMYVAGCANCKVTNNSVHGVLGGQGGGVKAYGKDPLPGSATGIRISNCTGAEVTGNVVHDVATSWGIEFDFQPPQVNPDGAVGIRLTESPGAAVHHNLVYGIMRHAKSNAGVGACVAVSKPGEVLTHIEHLTCHGDGAETDGLIDGVAVTEAVVDLLPSGGLVAVTNSIIQTPGGACLRLSDSSTEALLQGSWSALTCGAGQTAGLVALSDGIIAPADAGFTSPADGDFALLPSSPCIDVGDPLAPFCLEPTKNGATPNLGVFGSTDKATPGADAVLHIPCP